MKEKVINLVKNNKRFGLLFICVIMFLFIVENVLNREIAIFDTYIYTKISLLKTNIATNIFKIITQFGSAVFLIGISVISLIILKNKKIGVSIALNLVCIGLLNALLKNIIQRPRPVGFRLIEETGYSFPSGHSMASMAFYGLIIYFVFKYVKNKPVKITICTILNLLIILIGVSRIYLGVHYASDVIAGFIVSIGYLVVYISIVLKLIGIKNRKN